MGYPRTWFSGLGSSPFPKWPFHVLVQWGVHPNLSFTKVVGGSNPLRLGILHLPETPASTPAFSAASAAALAAASATQLQGGLEMGPYGVMGPLEMAL